MHWTGVSNERSRKNAARAEVHFPSTPPLSVESFSYVPIGALVGEREGEREREKERERERARERESERTYRCERLPLDVRCLVSAREHGTLFTPQNNARFPFN